MKKDWQRTNEKKHTNWQRAIKICFYLLKIWTEYHPFVGEVHKIFPKMSCFSQNKPNSCSISHRTYPTDSLSLIEYDTWFVHSQLLVESMEDLEHNDFNTSLPFLSFMTVEIHAFFISIFNTTKYRIPTYLFPKCFGFCHASESKILARKIQTASKQNQTLAQK